MALSNYREISKLWWGKISWYLGNHSDTSLSSLKIGHLSLFKFQHLDNTNFMKESFCFHFHSSWDIFLKASRGKFKTINLMFACIFSSPCLSLFLSVHHRVYDKKQISLRTHATFILNSLTTLTELHLFLIFSSLYVYTVLVLGQRNFALPVPGHNLSLVSPPHRCLSWTRDVLVHTRTSHRFIGLFSS